MFRVFSSWVPWALLWEAERRPAGFFFCGGDVQLCCGKVDRASQFRSALRTLVTADLQLGYHPHRKPPAWCLGHNMAMLELTLHRHHYTRAATAAESPLNEMTPEHVLSRSLLRLLNGDWRAAYLEHNCSGASCPCGGTLDRCIDSCVAVLEALLCDRLGERVPSTNKWWTMGPTLEAQCLGLVIHRVLSRLSDLSSNRTNAVQVREGAAEDSIEAFRLYNSRKDAKSRAFLGSLEAPWVLSIACAAGEPMDHLMARIQRLDECGFTGWLMHL